MYKPPTINKVFEHVSDFLATVPEHRIGQNIHYTIRHCLLLIIIMFTLQIESINDFINKLYYPDSKSYDKNAKIPKPLAINIQKLFNIVHIPSANGLRNILDGCKIAFFNTLFFIMFEFLKQSYIIDDSNFGSPVNGKPIVAIDGTQTVSSNKISWNGCLKRTHNKDTNPKDQFFDSYLSATYINIDNQFVFNLALVRIENTPEDELNQTEFVKQDCEIKAAYRILPTLDKGLHSTGAVIIADDLMAHEPFVSKLLSYSNFDYICTCKESSHKHIYSFLSCAQKTEITIKSKKNNSYI